MFMSWEKGQDCCQQVMTLKHDKTLDRTGDSMGCSARGPEEVPLTV